MQIFAYAMQMEKDGEAYYRQLANKSPDPGLTTILTMLADQEAKHLEVIQELKEGHQAQLSGGKIRKDLKNVFAKLQKQASTFDFSISQIDLYKKAEELEQKSRDFYLENANTIASPAGKELFNLLAGEEKLHAEVLESLIEFVSRPESGMWLENAEWYHLDEY